MATTVLATDTQFDFDTLGSSAAGSLLGGSGNDKIFGGAGADVLDGGAGSDDLKGGSGNDTLIYKLGENAGSTDVYTGGSGIDTVQLQLTQSEWTDPTVRAQLERYVAFLGTVKVNPLGEVSSGLASDFVFSFPNGATLTVQMMERLVVAVQNTAGQYVIVQHLTALVTGPSTGSLIEAGGLDNADVGTPTATGDLFADDLNGPDDHFVAVAAGAATTHGWGTYGISAAGVWTYVLDNTNAAVQGLTASSAPLTDSFTVFTEDGAAQLITVNITGANDNAAISVTAGGDYVVLEAGGVANGTAGNDASGDLDITDVDTGEAKFQAPASLAGTYGDFTFDALTGAWTYALDQAKADPLTAGQPVTDSLTVFSFDNTDSETITVNITGSNDAATITGTDSGAVTEAGGVGNAAAGTHTASGTLISTDVDNAATFQIVVAGTSSIHGYGSYQVGADGLWTYALDEDNVAVQALNTSSAPLTDTFHVLSEDGTDTAVSISINGQNDSAVVTGTGSGTVMEANALPGTPTASGDLLSADVDDTDDAFQAVAAGAASANAYGTYGVTADGVWTYTLDNTNAAVQALNNGGTLSDSFSVLTADGTAKVVEITIQGATDITNSAPTDITLHAAPVGGNLPGPGTIATLSTTDADAGDTHTYSIVGPAGIFAISGANLNITSGLSNNTVLTVQIESTDSAADSFTETFNVITGSGNDNTLPTGGGGLTTDDLLFGFNNEDLVFGGAGDDGLFGQDGNDSLNGGAGNDSLEGGNGADVLSGGGGNDTLTGSAGNDVFLFNSAIDAATNVDVISDFVSGADKINLENTGAGLFNALPTGTLAAAAFDVVGAGPAASASTRIIYDAATGALSYDSDGTGAAEAVQIATVGTSTHPALAATDIVVI